MSSCADCIDDLDDLEISASCLYFWSVSKHLRVLNISHHSKPNSIFVGKSVLLAEFAEDGIMVISLRVASCTGRLSLDR